MSPSRSTSTTATGTTASGASRYTASMAAVPAVPRMARTSARRLRRRRPFTALILRKRPRRAAPIPRKKPRRIAQSRRKRPRQRPPSTTDGIATIKSSTSCINELYKPFSSGQMPLTFQASSAGFTSVPTPMTLSTLTDGLSSSACHRRRSGPSMSPVTFTFSRSTAAM